MANFKTSIGGQALIEGIMMKGPFKTAIAVRCPDGTINVKVENTKPNKFKSIPILRGMAGFFDSLTTGYKSLMHSANVAMVEEEPTKFENWLEKKLGKKSGDFIAYVAGVMGAGLSLVLFMILPTMITGFIARFIELGAFKAAVEGALKLAIFLSYLFLISRLEDVKRVFSYHGAEHKTIACFEAGDELTVENVRKYRRFHPRCGTSFLLIILVVSIIIFSFVPWHTTFGRVGLKLLCLPLVVGVSYEILKLTGRYDNFVTRAVAAPGMWFQHLTTNEPDDSMIEVAIKATNEVIPQSKEDAKW
ncbi:MAG: DUF1385 domain-containing protein [Oscillospiraceae bacterium]